MGSMDNESITEAIILAGGFGTRLQSVVSDRPKALVEVSGRPFIEYQLEWLMQQGIRNVTLAVHYMAEQLQVFTEQWDNKNINLSAVYEQEPLGTGGGMLSAAKNMDEIFLVLNGDTFIEVELEKLYNFHISNNSMWTLSLFKAEMNERYMGMEVDQNGRIISINNRTL